MDTFRIAKRLQQLPVYLFDEMHRLKEKAIKRGIDVIDLGIGDPDLPTPSHIVEAMKRAVAEGKNHHYSSYRGNIELRQAVAQWYLNRFGVELDPETEILPLIGSKEGIGHIHLAYINPGDSVLVPDPGYPTYQGGTILAGGIPLYYPLRIENNFLPNLREIEKQDLKKVKIMHLNFPSNPTTATASIDLFNEIVEFGNNHHIMICHDAAYSEIYYDGFKPCSYLQANDAKMIGVEFHSLSKTFQMTGWRIGVAVGKKEIISALASVKSNYDTGIFQAVQIAGVAALRGEQIFLDEIRDRFKKRRDIIIDGMKKLGYSVQESKATFYVWGATPENKTSEVFYKKLLDESGVLVTPGAGFGKYGEGYFRVALTLDENRLHEAIERMGKVTF